jgi:hypothetical protein
MLYYVCKAKNDMARNEHEPQFNPDNWEIITTANCRSNATTKTWHSVFYPIYEKLRELYGTEGYRLWNFKECEITK